MRLLSRVGVVLLIAVIVSVGPLAGLSPARASGAALLGAAVVTNPYFLGLLAVLVAGGLVIHNWDQISAPGGVAAWFVDSDLWSPAERLFMFETLKVWVDSGLWLELNRPDVQDVLAFPGIFGEFQYGMAFDDQPMAFLSGATGYESVLLNFPQYHPDYPGSISGSIYIYRVHHAEWGQFGSVRYPLYVDGQRWSDRELVAASYSYDNAVTHTYDFPDGATSFGWTYPAQDPSQSLVTTGFRTYARVNYTPGLNRYLNIDLNFLSGVNFDPWRYEDYAIAVPVNFGDLVNVTQEDIVGGGVSWADESQNVVVVPYVPSPGDWTDEDTTGLDAGFAGVIGALNRIGEKLTGQGTVLDAIRGGIASLVGVVSGIGSAVSTATAAVAGIAAQVAALPTTIVTAVEGQLVTWFVPTHSVTTDVQALKTEMSTRFPLGVLPIAGCVSGIFWGGAAPLEVTLPSPLSPGGTYTLTVSAPGEFSSVCQKVTRYALYVMFVMYLVGLGRRFLFSEGEG